MKIAIDARFYGLEHAGLGRYTLNLVQELAKLDKENSYTLFVWEKYQNLDLPENFTTRVVNAPHHTLREQILLPLVIGRKRFDLVHFPHFIVPLLNFTTPFVVTIHDLIKHKYGGAEATTLLLPLYYLKRGAYRLDMWWAVNKGQHIITPTKYVKEDVVKYFQINPNKVTFTREGVDTRLVTRSNLSGSEMAGRLKLYGLKGSYLLYVGNSYPYKNVETLLGGLKLLPEEFQLAMVGSRDVFVQRIEALIRERGLVNRVKVLGYVPDGDLGVLYSRAVALVSATLEEGFGITPLEAMGLGCPAVISDIPVFKETCGQAALYFDPQKPDELAKQILRLHGDKKLRGELIQVGHQRVQRYSWKKMAQETLQVYQEVAG